MGCEGPYIENTKPPPHLDDCIRQYRIWNKSPLFVLTDAENVQHITKRRGVYPVAIEDYRTDKVDRFQAVFNYPENSFWSVSTTRFFYLEEFVRQNDLAPFCHFENDVLVYFNLKKYGELFSRLYSWIAATLCDDDHMTSGFMYIYTADALSDFNDFILTELKRCGVQGFEREFKVTMVNDMTLLRRYSDTSEEVDTLPIRSDYDKFDYFRAIFDPGDYGQHVGGTRGFGPGVVYAGHYVGKVLSENPGAGVVMKEENGLRVPFFSCDGQLTRMNSLHVHSKRLKDFMSDGG